MKRRPPQDSHALATAFAALAVSVLIHAGIMAGLSGVRLEELPGGAWWPRFDAGALVAGDFTPAAGAGPGAELSRIEEAAPAERAEKLSDAPESASAAEMPADAAADPAAARLAEAPDAFLPPPPETALPDALDVEAPAPAETRRAAASAAGLPRILPETFAPAMPEPPPPDVKPAPPPVPQADGARAAQAAVAAAAKALEAMPSSLPSAMDLPAPSAPGGGMLVPFAGGPGGNGAQGREVPVLPEMVMLSVDEAVVEAEKEAVRKLVDGDGNPGDLAGALAFDVKSAVFADEPEARYFELRMSAGTARPLKSTPKDFVMLLDVSASMSGAGLASIERYFKEAMENACSPGDSFNVVWFNTKFDYLFSMWMPFDGERLQTAAQKVAGLSARGTTDFFSVIKSVLTLPRRPERPLVAIAVTDGEATAGVVESPEIVGRFSRLNGGLVSVNVYAIGDGLDGEMLDYLTIGSRGRVFRQSRRDLGRCGEELPGFAAKFKSPVLTDISMVFGVSCRAETYPALPENLYREGETVVRGRCPADCRELVFTVRGLNGAESKSGLFKVPLGDGAAARDPALRRMWALMKMRAMLEEDAAAPSAEKKRALRAHAAKYMLPLPGAKPRAQAKPARAKPAAAKPQTPVERQAPARPAARGNGMQKEGK